MSRFVLALLAALTLVGCIKDSAEPADSGTPPADADGDGYLDDEDCDDDDPAIHPGASELCDGVDNDCDGALDEDSAVDASSWYLDSDGDGFGDPAQGVVACLAPGNHVASDGDCDDSNPFASPDREELCATPYDDDCDGSVNEADAQDATEWFPDIDGDGYGLPTTGAMACEAPAASADNDLDCDDGDAAVSPDADEVCDGIDNDCDGDADESESLDALWWYPDVDGDGYGDLASGVRSCESSLSGHVADSRDCDDSAAEINPDGVEVCDGVDNDCDGTSDEPDAVDALTWYLDADGDGYGLSGTTTPACEQPSGYEPDAGDCDDGDSSINPMAEELCDGADNDCDGDTDEDDATDATGWYVDADGDGEGAGGDAAWFRCSQPSGYVSNDSDCDDSDATLNASTLWYYDADLDGYGVSSSTVTQCADPGSTYVREDGDCRPADADDYPGADEYCDAVDNDCDGDTDEDDAVDTSTWYADADSDSWGDASVSTQACSAPSGYVSNDQDCDDADASVEVSKTWYLDADSDGEGDSSSSTDNCTQPSGYVLDSSDCDDADATLNSSTEWFYDGDLDGYGAGTAIYTQCSDPGTYYVQTDSDCEASDASSYPGAEEVCLSGTAAEGVDNDCDGDIDEGCATPHCGTISTDETWSASEDHIVTCNVYVQGSVGPVLTIDAGTTVSFSGNTGILVGYTSDGDVAINGTSASPVVFTSAESSPAAGDYAGLMLLNRANSSVVDNLSVSYAGSNASFPASVYVSGVDVEVDGLGVYDSARNGVYVSGGSLLMANSDIQDSASNGIYLTATGYLDTSTDFTSNTLSGNGGYPIVLNADDVDALDTSSTFGGNGSDRIQVRGGTLSQDSSWSLQDVDYELSGSLYVQSSTYAPLWTVEDGVTVEVTSGGGIYVGASAAGEMDIQGSSAGVTFTSGQSSPAAGDWVGVVLGAQDRGSSIEGLELAYAGGSSGYQAALYVLSSPTLSSIHVHDSGNNGVLVASAAEPSITDSTIEDNGGYGVYVSAAGMLGTFTGNTLTGNTDAPITLPGNYVGQLDSSSSYSGNGDDWIEVETDTLSDSASWEALDVDYRIYGHLYVQGSSTPVLSIEDGATLEFASGRGLYVGLSSAGALALNGDLSTGDGITLTSSQSSPTAGDWVGVSLGSYTSASSTVLEGFTLEYAGYGSSYQGGLYVGGVDVDLSDCALLDNTYGVYVGNAELGITDCEISDNSAYGVYLHSTAGLSSSFTDNALTGNGTYPIRLPANSLGQLDSSSSFTGNGSDFVYVTNDIVTDDATWQPLDVDYYFTEWVYIQDPAGVLVEADNTTLYMAAGVSLLVGQNYPGALQADSATFTSALSSPAAGDWYGITFGYYATDGQCSLTNSSISYGGANGKGNVYLYYTDATLTGNTITDSSTYGIYGLFSSPTVSGNSYSGNASGDTYGL